MNSGGQDPWTWGFEDNAVEDSHNDEWRNTWNTHTKEISNQMKLSNNQRSDIFGTVILSDNSPNTQQNWGHGRDSGHTSQRPQTSAAKYFNNNNCQSDVENKEVAPPDNHFSRNSRQILSMKDLKHDSGIIQEQKAPPLPHMNQNIHFPGNSGASATVSTFGIKQYPEPPRNQQDGTFQTSLPPPTFLPSLVPSAPFAPVGQLPYYPPSTHPSFFFTPTFPSNNSGSGQEITPNSLTDSLTQSDSKSSFSGPFSIPPSHSVQNSVINNNKLDHSSISSSKNNSVQNPHGPEVFSDERNDIASSLFPQDNFGLQDFRHQVHDVPEPPQFSHISQINITNQEKSNTSNVPAKDSGIPSNQSDFAPQISHSDVLSEEITLQPPIIKNSEVKDSNETFTHQLIHNQISFKPQVPLHSQGSEQQQPQPSYGQPQLSHQQLHPSQQLPQTLYQQPLPSNQQTLSSQQQIHPSHQLHQTSNQETESSHNQSHSSFQQSQPFHQQPLPSNQTQSSHHQSQSSPQQPQPFHQQLLPSNQQTQSSHQQPLPPYQQPLPSHQQPQPIHQLPLHQQPQFSHHQLPESYQPPTGSYSHLHSVSQNTSEPIPHHPPVSQQHPFPLHTQITHQSQQQPQISHQSPIPFPANSSSQTYPFPESYKHTGNHQVVYPPNHQVVSPPPPLSNQPQEGFSSNHVSLSHQPPNSHPLDKMQSTGSSSTHHNDMADGSQAVESEKSQIMQNSATSDFSSVPLDLNHSNKKGLQTMKSNLLSKDIENESKVEHRFTPSPKQVPAAQTPPIVTSNQSSKVPQNNHSNVISHASNAAGEKIPFDNETHNYGTPTSRGQISFNYQNMYPVASSSPVPASHIPENQERLPENRELPDNTENLHNDFKKLSINRERENEAQSHCQVDRNQYLETGHLSGSKDHILTDNSPNVEAIDESEAPPPGLHRLVTGQGCEGRGPLTVSDHQLLMIGADSSADPDPNRHSSPSSSTVGSVSDNRNIQSGHVGDSESDVRSGRLVQGQSIGDDTDTVREVPGEATPFHNRIVLGQMGREATPPLLQDSNTTRGENSREREIVGRMVVGERYERDPQNVSSQDEFRQSHRSLRRNRRGESSYEDEDHEYPSDRDRRIEEYKRRGDDRDRDRVRQRSRREHRSPEYRSDEDFEDRRGFARMGRSERRQREFSPELTYYNNYRDDHRRHRRYDYREYDDDYYYRENRSRPSSRTGSDYRRANMDYMCGRVPRLMFYPDMGGIPYNPRAPEEYYETMRRVDPMGYAAWYNQYMSSRYNVQQSQANFNNDRASVHSGQSSTNNRPNVETPQEGVEDITKVEDLGNISAHVKGKIDSFGRLLVIDPHYPVDNQKPSVNLFKIEKLPTDPDVDEFLESPGPFVPGVTHRNTVLQYLRSISDRSIKSSEKLLYDLIHLSVKSNGELNGLDVADLLMESYKMSQIVEGTGTSETVHDRLSTKDTLTKFRELLQQGNKTEALEWAIEHGSWGHALFLASKMDERTHNNIMLRFANSIPHNDPLQTLYQLMSGHVPQASTCCADKKWSDWRPHLAMILGNPTGNPHLDKKAIIKLGDSLFSRGRVFASHFCYIVAQADFTSYQPDAKFVLLGSSPNQEFSNFATCRAIMVTMCYEYGLKLRQANANIPTLQLYKIILASRLIDNGKNRIALQYCELIANEAVQNNCERSLIASVIDLSSKLKMLDPTLSLTGDVEADPDWLAKLKDVYNSITENNETEMPVDSGEPTVAVPETTQEVLPLQEVNDQKNDVMNTYSNESTTNSGITVEFPVPSVQPVQQPLPPLTIQTSAPTEMVNEEEQQVTYQQPNTLTTAPPLSSNTYNNTEPFLQQNTVDPYWNSNNGITTSNVYRQETVETTAVPNSKNNFFKASEEHLKLNEISQERNRNSAKTTDSKPGRPEDSQNSGWFGGIWEKFSIRPKNQMRLPDDSNPSIVWDEQKKKWVNLDGDNDGISAVKPPPRAEAPKAQPIRNTNNTTVAPPALGNKYKIQKGKLMKSNYVDIMGNSKKSVQNPVRPMDGLFPTSVQHGNTNFFVPTQGEGSEYQPVDFINTGAPINNNKPVEGNPDKQEFSQGITAPTMYNPARYPISNDC